MPTFLRFLGVCSAALLSACAAAPTGEPAETHAVAAQAPALGKADSTDSADRGCQLVLREVGRTPAGDGYAKQCAGGVCTWVWSGHVDVSMDAFPQGADVRVLYRLSGDTQWWEVPASAVPSSRPGQSSYLFQVSEHLVGPTTGEAELAVARVELIPFLRLPDGRRLFDHNRRKGDFDVYSFGQAEWFALGDEPVCQAVAGTIFFQDDWQENVSGALHAGGWLGVFYDLDRLPQCRGTHNGYPAWDTSATVQFEPGGQLTEASVRDLVTLNGTPTNTAVERQIQLKIPGDATRVKLWFHNWSGAGSSCDAWDSSYGENYSFDVLPPVDDARCKHVESWTQIYGGKPTCTPYAVDEQHEATHCELHVNGFGHGFEGHYGIPFEWLEAYVVTGTQDGELLNAGMYTRYTDAGDAETHERYSLGAVAGAGTYKTGFTYRSTGVQSLPTYTHSVQEVAFFVDVKRPSGKVVRLWQSRGGANYGWDDAFGAGTITQSIPYGNMKWAVDGATIFDAEKACE